MEKSCTNCVQSYKASDCTVTYKWRFHLGPEPDKYILKEETEDGVDLLICKLGIDPLDGTHRVIGEITNKNWFRATAKMCPRYGSKKSEK